MRSEKAIQERRAVNPALFVDSISIVQSLLGVVKSTRALMALKLAPIGLNAGNDELLVALQENEPMSVGILADKLNVRASTASKAIDRLVELGLIERTGDNRDSRRTMVRMTDAGMHAREQVKALWREVGHDLTRELGVFEADDMAVQLEVTNDVLHRRLSRLR